MKKIKVLYLITHLVKNAGPINQAYNLATAFRKLPDVDFQIACISDEIPGNSFEDKFNQAGVKVVRFPHKSYEIWKCIQDINDYVKKNEVDIVHSAGLRPDLVNALLGRSIKRVTTQRSELINISDSKNKLVAKVFERIELYSIKGLDKVIACSKSLASIIESTYRIRVDYVQNSVDTDYFTPVTREEKIKIRQVLGLPCDRKIILFAGCLIARKNIDYLVSAYKNSGCNALLVLIGDNNQSYERIYKKMNNNNILFLGQKNPRDYVRCADFTISASLSEGLPNSSLESMACGIPMLLSDIGPHKELFEYGDIGVLFSTKREENLKHALEEIMRKDYEQMVKNCLDATNNYFSKYQCAYNYLKKYEELIK